MQKRILFLGASLSQIPPIKYAKEQGHYVITCDYLPENPGHKYADEYHNISTVDKEAILDLARKLNIDGIVAYASDVSAPTQAYVGNKLGLPSNPYESVLILTRKDLFRDFLKKNNFYVPESASFYDFTEAKKWLNKLKLPVLIKPIDSSGSKGITKIETTDAFKEAFEYALQFSIEKKVTVEEFLVRDGYQIGGDGFIMNGKLVFWGKANIHIDTSCNPLVPAGGSLPSVFDQHMQDDMHREVQRVLTLLNMKTGALNLELQYTRSGHLAILEIGARNGGNRIPEFINYATDINMVKYTVDTALGLDCSELKMQDIGGFYSWYMLHALQNGTVKGIWYSDEIKENIVDKLIYINIGDPVKKYHDSSNVLGVLIMQFSSRDEMLKKMDNMNKYIRVEIA
jgi:biotin carboxylase